MYFFISILIGMNERISLTVSKALARSRKTPAGSCIFLVINRSANFIHIYIYTYMYMLISTSSSKAI